METLRYKGFIGSIEAELEDNTLYGKVLGLNAKTMITYDYEIGRASCRERV